MDYGNTETPSMHHRLGSMTVTTGFPWGKQLEFPMGEIRIGKYSCKKKKKVISMHMSLSISRSRKPPSQEEKQNKVVIMSFCAGLSIVRLAKL